MKNRLLIMTAILSALPALAADRVASPDGKISLDFSLTAEGAPQYTVDYRGEELIKASSLGFEMKDACGFDSGFTVEGITRASSDTMWAPVWGENDSIRDNYNAMTVQLVNRRYGTRLNVEFRAYDDGIGLRYVFPKQKKKRLTVTDELTEFAMPGDITAWWIPGDYDTQEYEYIRSSLSGIRKHADDAHMGNVSSSMFSPTGVQTSLMLKANDSTYLNIHEAALVDFPVMHLNLDDTDFVFRSWLTPGRDGYKAHIKLPFSTPWRVIMIGDRATDILASNLVLNLNEPTKYTDTSWIKPVKYIGVWWEMIAGGKQWSYTDAEDFDLATFDYSKAKPHGRHSANTDNVKRYIDFAAANGFDQVLVEGWNVGWEDWLGKEKDYVFDFVTPYPDFDLKGLNDYARSKGVKLMMHHESSGSIPNYERWMDRAYDLMDRYGYNAVKSGYVGNILPKGENHYSQNSVNHYLRAVQKAADHHIMVNAHEAARPTGLSRTYPNLIGNESAMGSEYQNMSPGHVAILPFTRLKGGPMDFTPGIFEADLSKYNPGNHEHKRATVANQLALYVTMYSPLQMAADLPEHYEAKADAFQFIKDVPVDWKRSIYLDAEPGEYLVVAREDKHSDDWYVGGVTNADARNYDLSLDFLEPGATYRARLYMDGPTAHYDRNQDKYIITEFDVTSADTLPIHMAPGGGFALSLDKL
ncbi:MAG: glycoside hydrolase family 97 protein [Bacteroides sp.]|nr:glycoside hydrolase family 97 protein [Bacteroides sp.]MCM1095712.1 glycoside hydrolase family 97 protein [Terasakiella sp.]